jgi:cystathionine beta-lyase
MTGLGVETTYFHPELDDLNGILRPNTRLIYLESPGSHSFHIQDLARLSRQARIHGAITIADNSWATPLYQQPHRYGIDIVVHSGTKYIAGHSDVVVGLATVRESTEGGVLYQRVKQVAILLGATLGPAEAFLVLRGLRTLPVRMAQLQANGLAVARWLHVHPKVRRVLHPGLPDFPRHQLAREQMSGWSSLFSVELHPPADSEQRHRFIDRLRLFSIGVSWGGYESLIIPLLPGTPAIAAQQRRVGLNADCYRLSIGLENTDDLIADLEQGLSGYEIEGN